MKSSKYLLLLGLGIVLLAGLVYLANPAGEPAAAIPYTICQQSEQWTRPSDADQQGRLDSLPHFRGTDWLSVKDQLRGLHVQVEQRSAGAFRDFIEISGLWTENLEDDPPPCAMSIGGVMEIWLVEKRIVAVEQDEPGVYSLIIEPREQGYQSIHLLLSDLGLPGEQITIHYKNNDGSQLAPSIGWRIRPIPGHEL